MSDPGAGFYENVYRDTRRQVRSLGFSLLRLRTLRSLAELQTYLCLSAFICGSKDFGGWRYMRIFIAILVGRFGVQDLACSDCELCADLLIFTIIYDHLWIT